MVTPEPLVSYIKKFSEAEVLVLGDVMIDEFIYGRAERISPEAPVPVINVIEKVCRLGGAANVLLNIYALSGTGYLCGVAGSDEMGTFLRRELNHLGIGREGVVVEQGRQTTVKTRIIADQRQQVMRYDQEVRREVTLASMKKMLSYIKGRLNKVNAVIISDYEKGVVTPLLLKEVLPLAQRRGITVCVDHPKPHNYAFYRKCAHVITPNKREASRVSGIDIDSEKTLIQAGKKLLRILGCEAVLITRGEEGMSLFERGNGRITHIPTKAKEVYDVTGAGDTVIAALALALSVGASYEEAAIVANHAAGIVVSKLGTATVTPAELIDNIITDSF